MSETEKTYHEPHDRLTRIADAMTHVMDDHPETITGDRAVVMMSNDVEKRGGIALHGFEDETEAIVAMFIHLRELFRAIGKDVELITIPNSPADLEE